VPRGVTLFMRYYVKSVDNRGSALQRRLNEREKEMETDERDRQKEREELEDIRKKLLEDGHPDPEAEMERVNILPNN